MEVEQTQPHQAENQPHHATVDFKAFLMITSKRTNLNLYDHLVKLLTRVRDELPEDVVDVIEDISREVKRGMLQYPQNTLQDIVPKPKYLQLAQQQRSLFKPIELDKGLQGQYMSETSLPNVADMSLFLEQTGMGFQRDEIWKIFLAMKQLADTKDLRHCRFWGRILGIKANYIVAEVQFREGEEEEEEGTGEKEEEKKMEEEEEAQEMGEGGEVVDMDNTLPKSAYKPPPIAPKEFAGTGVNKFTYFVCQEPGLPWVRLPNVTPTQITVARQICKLFTGQLETPIVSYPPFPGTEANYLRAQIARISATTQVSPLGFYNFREDEGEEEGSQNNLEENLDFEGIPAQEMAESLSVWVHHTEYILPQGRCVWVNLSEKPEKEDEEEAEEEEEEEEVAVEPEVGPPLLTPLSDDAMVDNSPAWTTRITSKLIPQNAIAIAHSNLWPGAYALASGKKFINIYIGWGQKYFGEGYTPPLPPPPQVEYLLGPEIMEALDPSVEEEQAFKALNEVQEKEEDDKEQEEGEEEEEKEEEEEEEDD